MVLGYSVEAQVDRSLLYADRQGLSLGPESNSGRAGVFLDLAESSKKKKSLANRPGGQALLKALQPGDHLIVTIPSRLWRSLRNAENQMAEWDRIGVTLHFTEIGQRTDTANGRFMIQMYCAIAEWSNRVRGERTKEGCAWSARKRLRLADRLPDSAHAPAPKPTQVHFRPGSLISQVALQVRRTLETLPSFSGTIRAYIRVSRGTQTVAGQQLAITEYLARRPEYEGATIVWYMDEGASAFTKPLSKRPAGSIMLKDLSEGDLVMCVRADRLCRSLHSLIEVFDALESKGATGHMMDCGIRTDTPTGRVMLQMMTLVAEVESREISRSTKAGLMVRIAKKGIWATGVPAAFRHHEYKPDKKNPWIAIFSENEQIAIWTKLLRLVRKEGLTPAEAVKAVSRELAERYNLPVPRKRRYVIAGTEVSGKRVWQAIPELDALDEKYGWSLERHRLRQEFERSDPGREYTGFPCLAKHASRQYEVMSRWLDAINLEEITTDVVDRAEAAILRRLKSFAEQMGK